MGLRSWWQKVQRRRGGVYLWRTRKHRSRRRENGYVGESTSFTARQRDHEGRGAYGHAEKPWMDLDPVMYRVIPLPWWLCWKWVLRPLETLVILCTWPRYNHSKNLWNPRRVPIWRQHAQRRAREGGSIVHPAYLRAYGMPALGALLVLAGLVGAWATR